MPTVDIKIEKFDIIVQKVLNAVDKEKYERIITASPNCPRAMLHRAAMVEIFHHILESQYAYYATVLRRYYQYYEYHNDYPKDALPVFISTGSQAWTQYLEEE